MEAGAGKANALKSASEQRSKLPPWSAWACSPRGRHGGFAWTMTDNDYDIVKSGITSNFMALAKVKAEDDIAEHRTILNRLVDQ